MNILHKLFGKWEKESEQLVTVTYSAVFCKDWEQEVLLVIEVQTRTGKKRAYTKDILGKKTTIDIDFLNRMSKQC